MSSNNNNNDNHNTFQINNGGTRPGQNQLRRKRNANRIYRSYNIQINAPINNEDTLRRIKNLPEQFTDDLSLLQDQFFNGSSFY
jgi:hypothetical protein